jgi:hypothetical protein
MAKYIIEINNNSISNITPLTKSMEIENAKAILEDYVGDHIAVIGKGKTLSDRQKRELRQYADILAPIEDEDEDYDECEPNCGCHDDGGCDCCDEYSQWDALAEQMIARIREILEE